MNLTPEQLQSLYQIPRPEMIGYSKQGEETFKAGWDAALNSVYSKVMAMTEPEEDAAADMREPGDDCAHEWRYTGTAYGGDDERWMGEGRCYCSKCGADGDA